MKNLLIILAILTGLMLSACAKSSNDLSIAAPEVVAAPPAPTWVETPEAPDFGSLEDTAKPNITIIGDSISVGYTGPLIKLIGDKYDIYHPMDNCRNSHYTLANLDTWLAVFSQQDTIVWNNGVWDSAREEWVKSFAPQNPIENYGQTPAQYEVNLIAIARKMKATGARVIFMTTTDVPGGTANGIFDSDRVAAFNEIAKRVLPSEGVEVVDLYAYGVTIPNAHINLDIHFSNAANKQIASFIANIIKE